jgi:hypothetical protein
MEIPNPMTKPLTAEIDTDQLLPPSSRKVYVALDENGHRIGETHHHAKLSDREVDQIRDMRESYSYTFSRIAELMCCSRFTVAAICSYRRRATSISRWVAVVVHVAKKG